VSTQTLDPIAAEAASYDTRFHAEVQKELDDPSPEFTSEEAQADMARFFADLEKEISR
jgi:hypothetical protein